jgi:hypothetical protein
LRILHITAPAGFGGLESVVEMLSQGLLDRGHQVTVLAIVDNESAAQRFLENLEARGVPCLKMVVRVRDLDPFVTATV